MTFLVCAALLVALYWSLKSNFSRSKCKADQIESSAFHLTSQFSVSWIGFLKSFFKSGCAHRNLLKRVSVFFSRVPSNYLMALFSTTKLLSHQLVSLLYGFVCFFLFGFPSAYSITQLLPTSSKTQGVGRRRSGPLQYLKNFKNDCDTFWGGPSTQRPFEKAYKLIIFYQPRSCWILRLAEFLRCRRFFCSFSFFFSMIWFS